MGFGRCQRIAVGVTVLDPSDPAVTGFSTRLRGLVLALRLGVPVLAVDPVR